MWYISYELISRELADYRELSPRVNKPKPIMAVVAVGETPMSPVIAESSTVVMLVFVRMA
jgi:hypothetical protein